MNDTPCRYSVTGDHWLLTFMDGGRRLALSGFLGTEPEWLVRILDVAKVGGHTFHAKPTRGFRYDSQILWFRVDDDYNLTDFIEWQTN